MPHRASLPTKVFQFIRMRSIVVDVIALIINLINVFMAKVQHYRGLHTDLDHLYEAIKEEILWMISEQFC